MDSITVSRLRVYALLYKLEEMGAARVIAYTSPDYGAAARYMERHGRRMSMAIKMLAEAAGEACIDIEAQVAALLNSLKHIKPVAPTKIDFPEIGSYGQSATKIPERGFTGYCSNRAKYGPRTPKRR